MSFVLTIYLQCKYACMHIRMYIMCNIQYVYLYIAFGLLQCIESHVIFVLPSGSHTPAHPHQVSALHCQPRKRFQRPKVPTKGILVAGGNLKPTKICAGSFPGDFNTQRLTISTNQLEHPGNFPCRCLMPCRYPQVLQVLLHG